MDPKLIDRCTDALRTARDEEALPKFLELADKLGGLTKDLRETVAYMATDNRFANDPQLMAAFAPHRKEAKGRDAVLDRTRNILTAFRTAGQPFASHPEVFELLAVATHRLQGPPKESAEPADLADLAVRYVQAQLDPNARKLLAHWLYTPRGELSSSAIQMLAPPVPSWLKEKFEQVVGDARPRPSERPGFWRATRERLGNTWREIAHFQPSFLLALLAISFATLLFVVSLVAARPSNKEPSPANAPRVDAQPAPPVPTVYQLLTRRLKEKQEILAGSILVISPRARDDGDIQLTEAVTAADLKNVVVVPWSETREALGGDTPPFGKGWMTAADLARVRRTSPVSGKDDDRPTQQRQSVGPTFYVDLEMEAFGHARVSVISTDAKPGVLLLVRGSAVGLQPSPHSSKYLARVLALGGDPESATVGLSLRQARSAASTDAEHAQVELTQALVHVAGGNSTEAEEAARRALAWGLTAAEKERLPDPLRRKVTPAIRSLDERVREKIELKK